MSPAQNMGFVELPVLHEVAHRLDAVLTAPVGHSAVHRPPPGLGEGVHVLEAGGRVVVARQAELVGGVGLLPVHLPLGQDGVQFRAPVAARLGLVVEEAGYGLAEVGLEVIVVRLVYGGDEPVHAVLAGAVDAERPALSQRGALLVGEVHDLPLAGGRLPGKLAVADAGGEVHEALAVDGAVVGQFAGQGCHVPRPGVAVRLEQLWPLDVHGLGHEHLGGVLRRDLAADHLAWPPLLIEDPHLQVVLPGRIEADGEVLVPAGPEPVVVGARLGRERPVAGLGHLGDVLLKAFLALRAVEPEQRPGESACLHRQRAKLPLDLVNRRLGGSRGEHCDTNNSNHRCETKHGKHRTHGKTPCGSILPELAGGVEHS